MEGRIIKGVGGLYYVHTGSTVYGCRARGIFRKDNFKPLPGDLAEISVLDEAAKEGVIDRILERKNALIRPAVANVDQAMVIFAMASPAPGFSLLDRFLVMMERQGIPPVLVFNKRDLVSGKETEAVRARYAGTGYPTVFVSALTDPDMEAVRELLRGKTTTVAGPSGVGKSSLINRLQSGVRMDTGAVSERIGRGRHTTRHTELLFVEENTWILDTPGFSSLELPAMEKEELGSCFPEIRSRQDQCRFAGCSHLTEPDCAVRRALEQGAPGRERYEAYRLFYKELKGRRKYK